MFIILTTSKSELQLPYSAMSCSPPQVLYSFGKLFEVLKGPYSHTEFLNHHKHRRNTKMGSVVQCVFGH